MSQACDFLPHEEEQLYSKPAANGNKETEQELDKANKERNWIMRGVQHTRYCTPYKVHSPPWR